MPHFRLHLENENIIKPIARAIRIICLTWLAWALLLIGYQGLVGARFRPQRPDYVLFWTPTETTATSQNDKPYLIDPFMNAQVSWDSEYYLSIAVSGYEDPRMRAIYPEYTGGRLPMALKSQQPGWTSMNYAFFPAYPYAMKLAALPLRLLKLNPIATATLAGVIVSALGTLLGMLSLYTLVRSELDEAGGLRAAFFLIIVPTGFFLAQVYTEGLFVGLAFSSLVMMRRKKWLWATLLSTLTIFTRPNGLAILLPLFWSLGREAWTRWHSTDPNTKARRPGWILLNLAWGVIPVVAFVAWEVSPAGAAFGRVQALFFGSAPFELVNSLKAWKDSFLLLFGDNPQTRIYYAIEFASILLAAVSIGLTIRRQPDLALLGLGTIGIALTAGAPIAMHRYVLAVPVIFLVLSRWGKNPIFERAWTVLSLLLMGLLTAVFTFDMFAG